MIGGCSTDSGLVPAREVEDPFIHVGMTRNGKKHGQWLTYTDGESFYIEHWRDGVRHGPFRILGYEMTYDGVFENGLVHGRYREFWDTRTRSLRRLQFYSHGKRERTWCEWDMDGKLTNIATYQEDELIREEDDPPGSCPVTYGNDRYHLDPDDRTYD